MGLWSKTVKYTYCLARHDLSALDSFPPGLGGAAVLHISFRGISTLVSDVDADLLSLYYMVDKSKLLSFKLAYRKFKRENPGLRLLYTGPWAPYNFADIDLEAVSR